MLLRLPQLRMDANYHHLRDATRSSVKSSDYEQERSLGRVSTFETRSVVEAPCEARGLTAVTMWCRAGLQPDRVSNGTPIDLSYSVGNGCTMHAYMYCLAYG